MPQGKERKERVLLTRVDFTIFGSVRTRTDLSEDIRSFVRMKDDAGSPDVCTIVTSGAISEYELLCVRPEWRCWFCGLDL